MHRARVQPLAGDNRFEPVSQALFGEDTTEVEEDRFDRARHVVVQSLVYVQPESGIARFRGVGSAGDDGRSIVTSARSYGEAL